MDDSLKRTARLALACLDLTSLKDGQSAEAGAADIEALCRRAQTPYGPVAAVCVWPRFVAQARALLPSTIRVAAVANFPDGALDPTRAVADAQLIAAAGGDEVDVVLPWRALQAGQRSEVAEFLAEVRYASQPLTLKVIIESGELNSPELITEATRMALMAGADFVKTSTGKTPVSATPKAAGLMLKQISGSGMRHAGFKASGGIRTLADAQVYLQLAEAWLGSHDPQRLRIGASGLLDDIEAVLGGGAGSVDSGSY